MPSQEMDDAGEVSRDKKTPPASLGHPKLEIGFTVYMRFLLDNKAQMWYNIGIE